MRASSGFLRASRRSVLLAVARRHGPIHLHRLVLAPILGRGDVLVSGLGLLELVLVLDLLVLGRFKFMASHFFTFIQVISFSF